MMAFRGKLAVMLNFGANLSQIQSPHFSRHLSKVLRSIPRCNHHQDPGVGNKLHTSFNRQGIYSNTVSDHVVYPAWTRFSMSIPWKKQFGRRLVYVRLLDIPFPAIVANEGFSGFSVRDPNASKCFLDPGGWKIFSTSTKNGQKKSGRNKLLQFIYTKHIKQAHLEKNLKNSEWITCPLFVCFFRTLSLTGSLCKYNIYISMFYSKIKPTTQRWSF